MQYLLLLAPCRDILHSHDDPRSIIYRHAHILLTDRLQSAAMLARRLNALQEMTATSAQSRHRLITDVPIELLCIEAGVVTVDGTFLD